MLVFVFFQLVPSAFCLLGLGLSFSCPSPRSSPLSDCKPDPDVKTPRSALTLYSDQLPTLGPERLLTSDPDRTFKPPLGHLVIDAGALVTVDVLANIFKSRSQLFLVCVLGCLLQGILSYDCPFVSLEEL